MSQPALTWDEYAGAWAELHDGYDPRRASVVVRGWLRGAYAVGRLLIRLRVTPTAVTGFGLLVCALVPVTAGRGPGWPLTAAALVLLGAIADTVDGSVAIAGRQATRLGYVYDSIVDRLAEAAWLLAFWLLGAPGLLVVAAGGLSWLHEYLRARARSAGMHEIGSVTAGERPTRVCVTLVGLLLAGLVGLIAPDVVAGVATVTIAIWALLAVFGFGQLLGAVRRALR